MNVLIAVLSLFVVCCSGQAIDEDGCKTFEYYPLGLGNENIQGTCSGHGTCVTNTENVSRCVCEDGWNGLSDFINTDGEDCQIHELSVLLFWIIGGVISIIQFGLGAPRMLLRYRQFKDLQAQKEQQGVKLSIWRNRGLLACASYSFICFPTMIAMVLLNVIKPNERIGVTWPMTILFAILKFGFYFAVWLFQPALLATVLKGKKQTRHLVKVADYTSLGLCLFAGGMGLVPIVSLIITGDGTGQTAMISYYIVMGGTFLQLILLGLQSYYVQQKVIKVLNNSYSLTKSARTIDIKKGLVGIQKENMIQCAVQGSVFGLFVFFSFMYNKHPYFFPLSVLLGYTAVGKKLAYTTVRDDTYATGTGSKGSTNKSSPGSKEPQSFSYTNQNTKTNSSYAPQTTMSTFVDEKQFKENVVSFHEDLQAEEAASSDGEESDDGYV